MPSRRRVLPPLRGFSHVWFLCLVAAAIVLVCAVRVGGGRAGVQTWVWLVGALAVGALQLAGLRRRDRQDFAKLVFFLTALPAMVAAVAVLAAGPHPVTLCVALGGGGVAGWMLSEYLRLARRKEVLPNLLLETAAPGDILERDGVQLCAAPVPGTLGAGGAGELVVLAQSCVDARREVQLKLEGPSRAALLYPAEVRLVLGPAEVACVRIPLQAGPGGGGALRLFLVPVVSGAEGTRVRYWRAREYERRATPVLQLLALAVGVFYWGGGWSVKLGVGRAGPEALPLPPVPPRPETLWSPPPGGLATARQAA